MQCFQNLLRNKHRRWVNYCLHLNLGDNFLRFFLEFFDNHNKHEQFNHEWPCQNGIRIFGLEIHLAYIQCTYLHHKFFWHAQSKFSNRNDILCARRDLKEKCDVRSYDKWNFKSTISSLFHFDQVTDGWMSHVLGVKLNLSIIVNIFFFVSRNSFSLTRFLSRVSLFSWNQKSSLDFSSNLSNR